MKKSVIITSISALTLSFGMLSMPISTMSAVNNNFNMSQYYMQSDNMEKKADKSKVVVMDGAVTITATKEANEGPQSIILRDIVVTSNEQKYPITIDDSLSDIRSLEVSPNKKYVAIVGNAMDGSRLIVLNLTDGKYKLINNIVKMLKNSPDIPFCSWSPDGSKLAFTYGDPGIGRVAIYNLPDETFTYIPREVNLIGAIHMFWSKKGDTLDYVGEYKPSQYKLYRYSLNTKKVKTIAQLTEKEVDNIWELNKF